ncbi:MAG: hemolysin family protein [Planktothrix sp. GU0601_MAG3]|nr:MAG: hemolysin family protein [Planktothrix sp. GU0601_MAG3]
MTLTTQDVLWRLFSVLFLITINAFFVTAEFSVVSVRRSRINQLVDEGDAPAHTVQQLQRRIDLFLSTTQLGITLSSLALGWIGEATVAMTLKEILTPLPLPISFQNAISHSVVIPIFAFFLIAYLQIVLGELYPKSLALVYPEQLSRFLAPPSLAIASFFKPFVWSLNQSTRWLLQLCGIQFTGHPYTRVTSEELQLMITTSSESIGLQAEERELLNNVFEFGDVIAEEIMVPRTSIVAIPNNATFQMLLDEMANSEHSRYPIMGESLDDILGTIDFRDLAKPLADMLLSQGSLIKPWVRPARFISQQMPLNEVLSLMQRSQLQLVIVVDEFGGTAGLVTIQDVIAEIIGDHSNPTESEDDTIQFIDDYTFLVQAQLDLEELNERLDLDLPLTEEYQTLGGFLIYQFQKIPSVGETLRYQTFDFTILSTEGPRLDQIEIWIVEPETLETSPETINSVEFEESQDISQVSETSQEE